MAIIGGTTSLAGTTQYSKANIARTVKISVAYVGSNFTGTKTKSYMMGSGAGVVNAGVSVDISKNERFVNVTGTFVIGFWNCTESVTVH